MTSLRSGVKLTLMKKLFLYIFLGLLWCNVGFANFEWIKTEKLVREALIEGNIPFEEISYTSNFH